MILAILIAALISFNLQAQVTIPSYSRSRQVENEIKRQKKKDKEQKKQQENQIDSAETKSTDPQSESKNESPQLVWAKYDFVPGDKVIFEDNLRDEENGEFPSRWDLMRGNVEIAEFGGENVIMFRDGSPTIIPFLEDPSKDYLPEVFTIEFDLYCGTDNFSTYLYDRKNQKSGSPTGYTVLNTTYRHMDFGTSTSMHPDEKTLDKRRWVHIAIAYNKGKLKTYLDDTRLINIPIMEDGKIIATGIRFDVGKATLKPESMGIINEMVEVMEDHPDLMISIEGHTDSDGDNALNLKLSEERAETVKNTMISLGISADRLSTKGFGETMAVMTNDTPEGKANNRRVEFVKM